MKVHGRTHTVGIIGWPVAHSLSPAIHNAAFAAAALDWVYIPMPVAPGRLASALQGLLALGFAGANVTMPHKTEGAERVDVLSEDAARLRSVNTVVVAGGELRGHNTDAPGFDRFLRGDAGFDPAGRTALILGAGGAARAVALALARGGAARITVAARDISRTVGVRAAIEGCAAELAMVALDDAADVEADLIVNATPLGAAGERVPTPELHPGHVVVDLLYRPTVTPLQTRARAAGAVAFGGLGLLLQQAALAFELWTGTAPSFEAMSAAALGELAERP